MRPIYSKLFWVWIPVWTVLYFAFSADQTIGAYISGIFIVPVFFVFIMDVPMVWMTAVLFGGPMTIFGHSVYQAIGVILLAVGAFSGWVEHIEGLKSKDKVESGLENDDRTN